MRGKVAKNKDELKSDRDGTMSKNPAVQQDQFGSRHNVDEAKKQQRRGGQPGGPQDLAFRESAQDTQPDRGLKNKLPGRRSKAKKKSQIGNRKG